MLYASRTDRVCLILLLTSIGCSPAVAETDVYESLDDVTIGRVFLAPYQRSFLDSRPAQVVRAPKPAAVQPMKTPRRQPKSSGYIISSGGKSRVWSKHGFVSTEVSPDMRFPGDVVIRRKDPEAANDSEPEVAHDIRPAATSPGDSGAGENGG